VAVNDILLVAWFGTSAIGVPFRVIALDADVAALFTIPTIFVERIEDIAFEIIRVATLPIPVYMVLVLGDVAELIAFAGPFKIATSLEYDAPNCATKNIEYA
jgi:hypothetical protein